MDILKRTILSLSLALLALGSSPFVSAATLDFDDLITTISPWDGTPNPDNGNESAYLPWDYGGFAWNHHPLLSGGGQATLAVSYQDTFTGSPYIGAGGGGGNGNTYPFPSPKMAVTNLYGANPVAISRTDGGLFDFTGAWFSSWGNLNQFAFFSARSITLTGYRGDTLHDISYGAPTFTGGTAVISTTYALSSTAFVWVDANFLGIDKLEIRANAPSDAPYAVRWAMDDFVAAAVPVPDSGALLMLGITGVAMMVRRQRHAGARM